MKGIVIGGNFNHILIREKSGANIELGDLLVCETEIDKQIKKYILEVYDIIYGSQISQQKMELFSGFNLETDEQSEVFHKELRMYKLAVAKPLVIVFNNKVMQAKDIPGLFSKVRGLDKSDLEQLFETGISIGQIRSGSKIIPLNLKIAYKKMFTHHILIPAQTGKGKSNLVKTLVWNALFFSGLSFFIIDPHNEYFLGNSDTHNYGLKDHPNSDSIYYYTTAKHVQKVHPNIISLRVSLNNITPNHLTNTINFSDAQEQLIYKLFSTFKSNWIHELFNIPIEQNKLNELGVVESTVIALKRKISYMLDLDFNGNPKGYFTNDENDSIADIVNKLESGKSIVIDSSNLRNDQELLIASIISTNIFKRYQYYKSQNILDSKPIISIVIEEAPRVLGKDVITKSNVFSSIAREGRKFNIGLVAITQLPSLIPREIIANINTKIILGIEMAPERDMIINSSAQDISELAKSIAALDKGEAIVTSAFLKFAVPITIPKFEDLVQHTLSEYKKPKINPNFDPFSEI